MELKKRVKEEERKLRGLESQISNLQKEAEVVKDRLNANQKDANEAISKVAEDKKELQNFSLRIKNIQNDLLEQLGRYHALKEAYDDIYGTD